MTSNTNFTFASSSLVIHDSKPVRRKNGDSFFIDRLRCFKGSSFQIPY